VIAITFALPAESSGVQRLLKGGMRIAMNETAVIQGELHGKRIALLHTGVGAKLCQQRLKNFLAAERFTCLISAGFAGALAENLRVGELFIAENFSSADLLASSRQLLATLQPRFGKLVTAPAMIEAAISRRELGARSGAEAVDMETEFIAQACAGDGVPLLSLRAISDTPAEAFPAPPHILFNLERQKTDFGRLALYLLRHPPAIVRLIQFSRRIANARATLTGAIEALIKSSDF
jgi:nucleoside phosphorylase